MRLPSRLLVAALMLGAVAWSASAEAEQTAPPAESSPGPVAAGPVAAGPATIEQARWLEIESAGFRIIFAEGDAELAAEVARIAPSVRERTTAYLEYDPDETIPVVLYGRTARANGFFTPFPPHIALFVAAPAGPWMGAATESWLEGVFVHELIHYLHLTRPIGLFGTASRVFGPLAAAGSVLFLPGWALEGITVTGETRLTPGGRGRNPYFEAEWVAPILAGDMYSLDQAGFPSPYAPRGRIYSAGYIMTEYLLATYGEDAFVRLNREFQRRPIAGMRRAIRRTTGQRADDVYAGMIDALEQRYAWRRQLPAGIAATPDDRANWTLLGAVDGGVAAFRRGPFDAGSIMYLPTGEHGAGVAPTSWRRIASVTPLDEYSVAVAANGRVAAVVAERPDLAGIGAGGMVSYGELFLVSLPGGQGAPPSLTAPRRLTRDTRLYHPGTDRTASFVVAAERRGPFSVLVEVSVPADPGEEPTVTPVYGDGGTTISMPAVSPDGTLVAAVENRTGRQSIVVLARETTPDGPQYTEVLRIGGEQIEPGDAPRIVPFRPLFSADGTQLWFVAHEESAPITVPDDRDQPSREALLRLYRLDLAGSSPAPTAEGVLSDQVAVLSGLPLPDGRIVYGTYRPDGFAIRIGESEPSSGHPVALTQAAEQPPGDGAAPPAPSLPGDPRRSLDLPRPVLWFPTVGLAGEVDGQTRFDLGAGMIAASLRGRHQVQAFAAWNPADAEPSGEVAWTWMPGASALTLSAARDYEYLDTDDPGVARSSLIAATLERPLWYAETPVRYAALVARVGGEYEAWDFSPGGTVSREEMAISGAARLLRYRHSGSAQIYGGIGGDIATVVRYEPEIVDRTVADLASQTTASAALGRPWGMVRIEPSVAVATSRTGAAAENLPWSAGSFDPEGEGAIVDADLAWMGRTAVSIAAPPLDVAWRSFALQRIGGSMYVEQSVDGAGAPDNHSAVGAEVTAGLLFNIAPLQITAGVVARLPHSPEAGDPALRYYVRLGGVAVDQVSAIRPAAPAALVRQDGIRRD